MDALDAIYRLSQVPTIIGWALMTGGIAAPAFLAGVRVGERRTDVPAHPTNRPADPPPVRPHPGGTLYRG